MSHKTLSASSSPWSPPLNQGIATGHEFCDGNKMDCDLVAKIEAGGKRAHRAKREQEWRNLRRSGKYEPCNVNGIQKSPTEIALENTRRNNKKLKDLLEHAENKIMELEEKYDQLEKEKDYWRKLCGLQVKDKVEFLFNKLEEEICTSCCERDKNSTDWCPYGCYHHN